MTYPDKKTLTVLLCILLFYGLAFPLILLDYNAGRAYSDQFFGHLPAIRFFVEKLEFSDYPSATTPGYHLLIAAFAKLFSSNVIFLKLVSSTISAALVGIFANLLYSKAGMLKSVLLLLPMIFSLYFLPDGVWLVPDNLSWLTVGVLFILTATTTPQNTRYYLYTGLLLLVAVTIRQTNIWLASIPWAAGLSYLLFDPTHKNQRIKSIYLAFLVTIPAFLLLLYFYLLWGGLVPPSVQGRHERGLSYCVPAFFFSLFFIYSFFYTPFILQAFRKILSLQALFFIAAGGILGFLVAVFPATDYNYDAGRFSGFWNFVRLAPNIGHVSILVASTSTLGGAVFFNWLLLIKKEFRFIVSISSLAFILALIPNALVLERYFSMFVFILIFIILYSTERVEWTKLSPLCSIGPLVFTLINLFFLYRGISPGH